MRTALLSASLLAAALALPCAAPAHPSILVTIAALLTKIVGIHLPAFFIGDLLTLFEIFHRGDDHGGMLWCCHQFVTRAMVLGETRILSVGTFVGLGMVQALSSGQGKLAQIRNDPIEFAFIPFF